MDIKYKRISINRVNDLSSVLPRLTTTCFDIILDIWDTKCGSPSISATNRVRSPTVNLSRGDVLLNTSWFLYQVLSDSGLLIESIISSEIEPLVFCLCRVCLLKLVSVSFEIIFKNLSRWKMDRQHKGQKKKDKRTNMIIYKTLHIKLQIDQHTTH
jgi:hypothetical protein